MRAAPRRAHATPACTAAPLLDKFLKRRGPLPGLPRGGGPEDTRDARSERVLRDARWRLDAWFLARGVAVAIPFIASLVIKFLVTPRRPASAGSRPHASHTSRPGRRRRRRPQGAAIDAPDQEGPTRAEGRHGRRASAMRDRRAKLGLRCGCASGRPVMGLRGAAPGGARASQRSSASRSYEWPSAATTGSRITCAA